MSKRYFTEDSFTTFINSIKTYINNAVSTKANTSHNHDILDISDLQTHLDDKVTFIISPTQPETVSCMWFHVVENDFSAYETVFPHQTLDFVLNTSNNLLTPSNLKVNMDSDFYAELVEGQKYIVVWDDAVYECVAISGTYSGINALGIGNASLMGMGENTGEPFAFGYAPSHHMNLLYVTPDEGVGEHIFAVFKAAKEGSGDLGNSVLTENTFSFNKSDVINCYMSDVSDSVTKAIVSGNTYTVFWDGTQYECVASQPDSNGNIYVGNTSIVKLNGSTNEPFLYGYATDGTAILYTLDPSTSHVVSIIKN